MLVLEVDMDITELDEPRAKWSGLTFEVTDQEGPAGWPIVRVTGDRDPLVDFVCWYSNDDIESATYTMSFVKEQEDEVEEDTDCEGHESLRGEDMGVTVYCDGSCRR